MTYFLGALLIVFLIIGCVAAYFAAQLSGLLSIWTKED